MHAVNYCNEYNESQLEQCFLPPECELQVWERGREGDPSRSGQRLKLQDRSQMRRWCFKSKCTISQWIATILYLTRIHYYHILWRLIISILYSATIFEKLFLCHRQVGKVGNYYQKCCTIVAKNALGKKWYALTFCGTLRKGMIWILKFLSAGERWWIRFKKPDHCPPLKWGERWGEGVAVNWRKFYLHSFSSNAKIITPLRQGLQEKLKAN